MATTADLRSRISSVSKELSSILSKEFRTELDTRTHILDLSYEALKVNVYNRSKTLSKLELAAYDSVYSKLITACVNGVPKDRTFTSIDLVPKNILDTLATKGVVLINNGINDIFIVGNSFESIRRFVTNKISKDPSLRASRFGTRNIFSPKRDAKGRILADEYTKTTRSNIDIGHIPTEGNANLSSPLEEKLLAVEQWALAQSNTRAVKAARTAINNLYDIQAQFDYSFKNTSPEAVQKAKNTLGEAYIVVTLQTSKKNNQFSNKEAAIYFKLLKDLAVAIDPTTISGSNNIIQDIAQSVSNIFTGKKSKVHATQKATTKVNIKAKTKSIGSVFRIPIQGFVDKVVPSSINLLAILQASINKQVAKNMGKGNEHRVLNYRTGRFAESVQVQRLSESRQGMITAFYSYMRNPYGTFSEGGRQQFPKSRDPKLLISKSVRELAAPIVGARMRAVLV